MFCDREQAIFWSTPEECAAACRLLLANDELRTSMVGKARQRIEELGLSNDRVCAGILDTLTADNALVETLSR